LKYRDELVQTMLATDFATEMSATVMQGPGVLQEYRDRLKEGLGI
ncbi:MAG: hypothetical protein GY826_04615, partial [Fuerstiella sp.]|nr:hypothetical protein [Fuerstiella sp.]